MRPLSSTEAKRQLKGDRFGRALLAVLMLLACLYPSPARAQQSEQDRQKAHRTAPPDWDAGLIGLIFPARRAKPVAALLNESDSIAPGGSFVNPAGAGTINNRAGSLRLDAGSASAPAQFGGPSNPPSTPDNWLGGPGNWSDTTKWSNGLPSSTSDVFIDNGNMKQSPVTLNVHAVINNLTVDSDDSLNISNGNTLSVNGTTVANAGTISLSAAGSGASLLFNASATLSGGGMVSMSNNGGNTIGATNLTNQETIQGSGNISINTLGTLNNSGTINANQSVPLGISTTGATVTNTGTLEATMGGTLQITGGTYNNTSGTIEDNASTLQIIFATINGGTITQSGAGTLELFGSTINTSVNNSGTGTVDVLSGFGVSTISGTLINPSGGQVTINNAASLTITAATISNAGTISMDSSGGATTLTIGAPNVTLTGGGTLQMSDASANVITGSSPSNILTNQETISGSGNIGKGSMALKNSGTINANQPTPLYLQISNGATNTGTIEATNGGTLYIEGGTYTNTGGTIQNNASNLNIIATATINGGTITQSGDGTLGFSGATINAPVTNSATGTVEIFTTFGSTTTIGGTLTNPGGGQVKIDNGGNLVVTAPTISNAGTISMDSSGSMTTLTIGAPNVTLTGGGTLEMSNAPENVITGSSASNILTNQETISGSGNIGNNFMALNNSGTINADQSTPLTLQISNGATNTGTIEAIMGGTLDIMGGTYTNTGGAIQNNASNINITSGATINGGTLTQTGAANLGLSGATVNAPVTNSATGTIDIFSVFGANSTIGGTLTNPAGGQVKIGNGANLIVTAPTISNAGTMSLNSSGSTTTLTIGAPNVTLSGGGTLTMSNNAANIITGSAAGNKLTNQETIQGSGNIGNNFMALDNSGTINGNQSAPLTLQISNGATNTGLIEASSGGTLIINGGTYTNTGGAIENDGGSLQIGEDAVINGGTLNLTGTSVDILGGFGTTINAPVTNSSTGTIEVQGSDGSNTIGGKLTNPAGGQVKIDNGADLIITSPTIANSGTIFMNSTGSTTELEIDAPKVTLSGKGMLIMSNNSANLITGAMPTDVLIFQGTLEGGGSLGNGGMGLTNSGTILANNGTLTIFPSSVSSFNNTGKLTVTSGNTLSFIGSTSNAFTTSGTVSINSGGNLTFQAGLAAYDQTKGSTTVDGKLTAANGINVSGGTFYGNLGTIAGKFNLSGTGAINPGDGIKKIGELTINGNFTIQSSTASSFFDLGGLSSGKFDVLNITNSASLSGKLIVDLVNNFKPVAGNTFDIMNYASESGMFSSETLPVITGDHWLVTIGATDIMLQLLSGSGPTKEIGGTSTQAASGGFFSQPAGGADYAGGVGFTGSVPPSALSNSQSGSPFDTSSFASQFDNSSFSNSGAQPTQTPEPSSLFLLGSVLLGTGMWGRRQLNMRAAKR